MIIERLWINGEPVDPESELFLDVNTALELEWAARLYALEQELINGTGKPGDKPPIGLIRSAVQ